MKQKLGGSWRTWTPHRFLFLHFFFLLLFYSPPLREEHIIFLASPAESEIWSELRLCSALWLAPAADSPPPARLPFLFQGERDSLLPRGSAAVMCSFRLACQPPFNWLARLEGRYQRRAVIDSHMKRVARTTVYQRPLVGPPFHWTLPTAERD